MCQDPDDLRQIGHDLVGRQVRDDRRHDDEIELRVCKWQFQFAALDRPRRVVEIMGDVEALEGEVRIGRRHRRPAPADAALHGIEAIITASFAIEILGERHGHAADAAADIENTMIGPQAAHADEMSEKLRADRTEITVAHKNAVRVRLRKEPVARHAVGQPAKMCVVQWRWCTDFIAGQGIDHAFVHSIAWSSGDAVLGLLGDR